MEEKTSGAGAHPLPLVEAAVDVVPFAMLVADCSARVLRVNEQWTELTGQRHNESLNSGWLAPLEEEEAERLLRLAQTVAGGGPPAAATFRLGGPTGPRWTRWWIHLRPVRDVPLLFMAAADAHDEYVSRIDLEHMATHDPLTGLLNHRFFTESVEQALRRTARWHEQVGLLYIDLDGFKRINDHSGHTTGDRVLSAVAARINTAVRGSDVVGRVGGDEFAVLIERLTSEDEAHLVARRVAEAIDGFVELGGRRWPITASVGLAVGGPTDTVEGLLSRADRAMYQSKRSRRTPAAEAPRERVVGDLASLRESMEAMRHALESLIGPERIPE